MLNRVIVDRGERDIYIWLGLEEHEKGRKRDMNVGKT